jgi:hypothetical protein
MSADFEFSDLVTDFGSDGRGVGVLFARQAGGYRLAAEAAEFDKTLSALAASWRKRKAVRVTVRGTEILRATPE